MCGRFTMTYPDAALLSEELGVPIESLPGYRPRFNIAPTDEHFIVRIKNEVREALPARWGLVNSWAKDRKEAAKQINARAETLATRPAFREAYAKRRCVVPADGFYEWRREADGSRTPFRFHRPGGRLVLMAGLYESWQPQPGTWERTFTIVTTRANGVVSALHDRMPVVLGENEADRWMFANTPQAELTSLLAPAPDDWLLMTAVSPRVNKVANDDPSVLEVPAPASQTLLL
jgi:putative SOS response-associated peptidase YedK